MILSLRRGRIGHATLTGFMHAEPLMVLAPVVGLAILDFGLVVVNKVFTRPLSHPSRSFSLPFSFGGFSRVFGIGILTFGGGFCTV